MITKTHVATVIRVGLLSFVTASLAFAQHAMPAHPATDAEKIADALRAGPKFITNGATILDWPPSPTGDYRVLRKGTNEWTCLPGVPGYSHDEPGCFDPTFLQWIKDGLAGKQPHIDRMGISYMYAGAWVPNLSGPEPKTQEFHVGPHIMVVSPHANQNELQALSHDGSKRHAICHAPPERNRSLPGDPDSPVGRETPRG
jgi:hypothetical protein